MSAPPATIIREEQQGSHTLALFGMSLAKAEMDFDFEIIKNQIRLATDEIGHATSEKQMYFLYTSKTELIMTALLPIIHNNIEHPLKDEYVTLEKELKACLAGYLSVQKDETGDVNEYKITMQGPIYGKESNSSGSVECAPKEYDRSLTLAEENLYRKMNCSARDHFRRALGLAFRLNVVSADDKMEIKKERAVKIGGPGNGR